MEGLYEGAVPCLGLWLWSDKSESIEEIDFLKKGFSLVNQRFHYITALFKVKGQVGNNKRWYCVCDCGRSFVKDTSSIKKTTSCGCPLKNIKKTRETLYYRLNLFFQDKYTVCRQYDGLSKTVGLFCKDCKTVGEYSVFNSVYRGSIGCKCNKRNFSYTREEVLDSAKLCDYDVLSHVPENPCSTSPLKLSCINCGDVVERSPNRLVYFKQRHRCYNEDYNKQYTYTYLLKDSGSDTYKIGITEDYKFQSRIADINRYQNHFNFKPVCKIRRKNRKEALQLEKSLHHFFRYQRFCSLQDFGGKTEMFLLKENDIAFIKSIWSEE